MMEGPNGERRRDDDRRAAAEIGHALGELWNERLALWQKGLAVLLSIGTVLGGVWVGGTAFGAVRADFGDVPQRLGALEVRFQAHIDTTTSPALDVIGGHTEKIDSLERSIAAARDDLRSLENWMVRLEALAESNNCWIRVAAGDEVRFNCSTTPNGTP